MNRRDFLGTTLASLVIPLGAFSLVPGRFRQSGSSVSEYLFYDERFPEAEGLAKRIAGPGEMIPVRGDITPVWNATLKSASRHSSLLLAGVTTESFCFCLKTQLHSQTGLDYSAQRISRDLYAWSIRSHHPNHHRLASS